MTRSFDQAEKRLKNPRSWPKLADPKLAELVGVSLVMYGASRDRALIPHIAPLYRHFVDRIDEDERTKVYRSITNLLDEDRITAVALLPVVICDPDVTLASTATLDLMAYSPRHASGLPYGLMELIPLITKRVPVNLGAVLGGLVSFGDTQIRISMDTVKGSLAPGEVQVAARCTTGFVTHAAMDFWLEWARELTLDGSDDALAKLGSAASALVLHRRHARVDDVRDVRRNYPAQTSELPVETLEQWTFPEYAQLIAPRLYALEKAEAPPKIFSAVLEEWGLPARAPVGQRFAM